MSKRWLLSFVMVAVMSTGCTIVHRRVIQGPPPTVPPAPSQADPKVVQSEPPPLQCAVADSPTPDSGQVAVFFTCSDDVLPSTPRMLIREEEPSLEAALLELLKGPTDAEQAKGYGSSFSGKTAGKLRSVEVTDQGRAIVDFEDVRADMTNASASAASAQLIKELSMTVFQFPEVKEVEYRINGNCDEFWNWLQASCQVISASGYR